jgi:hypothetical protein
MAAADAEGVGGVDLERWCQEALIDGGMGLASGGGWRGLTGSDGGGISPATGCVAGGHAVLDRNI